MTDDERDVIVEVLCSQALADHLGDVRDAESKLWKLLDAPELDFDDPEYPDTYEAWPLTRARLAKAGIALPDYLRGDDDA